MASTFISLPVTATTPITGPIEVLVDSSNDSIRIADAAGDTLAINPDGSINVSGIAAVDALVVGINEYEFGEALNVAIGGTSTVVSRFFATEYKLRRASCTGDNIAVYTVLFNSVAVERFRSTYTDFNCKFDYETGITIPAGTTVEVEVENAGNSLGNFSSTLIFSAK